MPTSMLPFGLPQTLPGDLDGSAYADRAGVSVGYDIFVRRNSDLTLVGAIGSYHRLTMTSRFNGVGNWALEVGASHPMAVYLQTPGYGIVVTRTIYNNAGLAICTTGFSGPMRGFKRENKGDDRILTVTGFDDMLWLAMMDAWPVTNYPYSTLVLTGSGLAPVRYYRLDDTGFTTTAVDSSVSAQNGTYSNTSGFLYGVVEAIDDTDTGVYAFGTDYLSVPTTGLPTGNSSWEIDVWFNASANPSPTQYLGCLGSNVAAQGAYLSIDTSGFLHGTIVGGSDIANAVSIAGTANHRARLSYNGTTLTLSLDGVVVGTATPGALNITYGVCRFGAFFDGSSAFVGTLDEATVYAGNLTTAADLTIYNVGNQRYAYQAQDSQTGTQEDVILHYVNNNLGANAQTDRQLTIYVSHFSVSASQGRGQTISAAARFDNLVSKDGTGILQEIARAGIPELGFQIVQSNNTLVFSVYQPRDLTSNAIFSDELGNLGDCTYEFEAPDYEQEGNYIVGGGAGDGTARTFVAVSDVFSISEWGLSEAFVDKHDTSDITTLTDAVSAALEEFQEKITYSFQLLPNTSLTYGLDFGLGDTVTCVLDGAIAVEDIIREVQIDLTPDNGEVVTMAVGTPGAQVNAANQPKYVARLAKSDHRASHKGQKLERRT